MRPTLTRTRTRIVPMCHHVYWSIGCVSRMFKSSVNRQRRRPGVRAYCTLSRPAPPLHLMVVLTNTVRLTRARSPSSNTHTQVRDVRAHGDAVASRVRSRDGDEKKDLVVVGRNRAAAVPR